MPEAAFAIEGGWDNAVVLLAANSWDDIKLADRHMAERLAAHAPVLYVDRPMSHLTRFNKPSLGAALEGPRLRMVAPRIARYTPVVAPKPQHPLMVNVTSSLVRRQLRGAVRQLGARVRAVISTWLFVDAYGACDEERRIYWWQDDPFGAASLWGVEAKRLARADERLARDSDLILTITEGAAERWRERGLAATHLPNGCDADFFAGVDNVPPATDVDLPGPIAGFVGHLNSRTDLAMLEAVAESGTSLLLIGPKDSSFEPVRFDALTSRANVAYVGSRPFEELCSYLRLVDVGLVPYADIEFNRWSFPLKTLEYLAAGRAVVATPLPAMKWLGTDLVTLADTPAAFASAVSRCAAEQRDAEIVRRRRDFANTHSWAERARQLTQLLE